jgi:D-glycero-D-manno-heptose 1,7-bisphosphate phosphatase
MTRRPPPSPAAPLPRPGGLRPAAFLDRDGTLVEDPGFQRDPAAVRLLPGATEAVARLNAAGLVVVVVTNQSGIARGFISLSEYAEVEARIAALAEAQGARIDATYHCPHYPAIGGPCECRKPGTLLYRRAADELRLDLAGSWGVGDRVSDLEPVRALGGRAALVRTGTGREHEAEATAAGFPVVDDLGAAADWILAAMKSKGTP